MYNCEILNMYDADESGKIETPELQRAIVDGLGGDELECVKNAWVNDVNISEVCPDIGGSSAAIMICAAVLVALYALTR